MVRADYYFRILTALTATVAAAVLAALLIASAPASAQEEASSFVSSTYPSEQSLSAETGVRGDTSVWVSFGGPMDSTTINSDTFTLVKQGTTIPVPATVTYGEDYIYDESAGAGFYWYWASLDPQADLEANTTYTATVKGGENGVKDASGAPMAGDYSWSFTTLAASTTPPETIIASAPTNSTSNSTSASIAFTSSKADSTFECNLDGAAFSSCTSPQSYIGLSEGTHTFQVRATDASGNTDPTPASTGWTVDATVPTISITSPADGATYQQGASIYASYSCSDSADSSPQCTGTERNGSAIDTSTTGTKYFLVTATDSAGNTNWKSVTYYVTKSGKVRGNR